MASLVAEMNQPTPVELPPEPQNPVREQVNSLLEAKRAAKNVDAPVPPDAQASVQRLQAMVKSHKSVSPSQDAMG